MKCGKIFTLKEQVFNALITIFLFNFSILLDWIHSFNPPETPWFLYFWFAIAFANTLNFGTFFFLKKRMTPRVVFWIPYRLLFELLVRISGSDSSSTKGKTTTTPKKSKKTQ